MKRPSFATFFGSFNAKKLKLYCFCFLKKNAKNSDHDIDPWWEITCAPLFAGGDCTLKQGCMSHFFSSYVYP
jgi:hypothetical protein